jgi:hypothetical protein
MPARAGGISTARMRAISEGRARSQHAAAVQCAAVRYADELDPDHGPSTVICEIGQCHWELALCSANGFLPGMHGSTASIGEWGGKPSVVGRSHQFCFDQ